MSDQPNNADLRLRAAVESSPSGLLMVDRSGRIVLVNREIERLFDYPREELLGQPVETLIPDRFCESHPSFRTEFLTAPSVRAMGAGRDLYGRRKDGSEIPVEIGLTPVATEEGILVLAAVVDISSRLRAEANFRAAVESSPAGVIMVDAEGAILLVNRAIERMFGYDRDELLGRSIEILVPARLRDGHPSYRAGFFAEPERRDMGAGRDLYGVRKDGTEFPVEIGLNPIRTEENGVIVLSSVVDISERKREEAERRRLEEQLRHSQKMQAVGTLAGGVAHDFNNILAAITTYAEFLRSESESEQAREDANAILETCTRGKTIVERILAFSRRREMALRPVAVADVVRRAETFLRATLPASVAIEVSAQGRDRIVADATSLEQVLMNLATNGAQAMPDGGLLSITVEPYYLTDSKARAHPTLGEGRYVALEVRDTGSGIDAEELERVFEPFYTTKETGSGTGLGLAMVDTIVAEHGGAVSIGSEVGKGTTVSCLFPVLDPEWVTGTEPEGVEEKASRGSGEQILLLDDEPVLAVAVERRLRALGYEVTTFTTPVEGLAAFAEAPQDFDLIITDYTMPEMNGLEFARRIAELRPGLPILLATGYVDDIEPATMTESGIAHVLRKPTTVEEMAATIARALKAP